MRHQMTKLGLLAGLAIVGAAASVEAATITSASFSLAYGATTDNTGPVWTTTETAGTNTPTTQGNFKFEPGVAGGPSWDSFGPTFVNRLLATGGSDYVGWFGDTGSRTFAVPIVASYTGAAPGDASGTPNYRLRLEITNISIYGARYDANALPTMAWDETTPGHTQTSPTVNLNIASGAAESLAGSYTQLAWDAPDYDEPIGSVNSSFTRTFDILPSDGADYRYGDGLVIEGRVHLVYDAIPEPASLSIAALGVAMLMCRRRA